VSQVHLGQPFAYRSNVEVDRLAGGASEWHDPRVSTPQIFALGTASHAYLELDVSADALRDLTGPGALL
jgi:hypothetical protein